MRDNYIKTISNLRYIYFPLVTMFGQCNLITDLNDCKAMYQLIHLHLLGSLAKQYFNNQTLPIHPPVLNHISDARLARIALQCRSYEQYQPRWLLVTKMGVLCQWSCTQCNGTCIICITFRSMNNKKPPKSRVPYITVFIFVSVLQNCICYLNGVHLVLLLQSTAIVKIDDV